MIGPVQYSGYGSRDASVFSRASSDAGAPQEQQKGHGASSSEEKHSSPGNVTEREPNPYTGDPRQTQKPNGEELTTRDLVLIRKLETADQQVRKHEQAHVAVGGRYVSRAAQYSYQIGPEGKRYAIGGEVQIDTSKEGSPEATVVKAQTVRRAALAPADPSPQDRSVAAAAGQMEQEARVEVREEQQTEREAQAEGAQPSEESTNAEDSESNGPEETREASVPDPTAERTEGPDDPQPEQSSRIWDPFAATTNATGQVINLVA